MMFDPIVFENIKVALENQLYDLDNLDERISIIDRKDVLNMAVMSREWSLRFALRGLEHNNTNPDLSFINAELVLQSEINDMADEILERPMARPACQLIIRFYCMIEDPIVDCPAIERIISEQWERGIIPKQYLSQYFGQDTSLDFEQKQPIWRPIFYYNKIELPLDRRIGEEQMNDFEQLIECAIETVEKLEQQFSYKQK